MCRWIKRLGLVLFLTGSDCHCKTVLQHFCTQIISDVYVQCSRLKTSRPVPQGSLVGYWVLPTPRHGAYGHHTCRVGRQNRYEHILNILVSQSLSYIVFFFWCLFAFFTLFASSVSQANRAGFVNFACFKMQGS